MGRGGDGRGGGGKGGGAGRRFGGGGYGSFGEYMVDKNRKLKEQFATFGSAPSGSTNLGQQTGAEETAAPSSSAAAAASPAAVGQSPEAATDLATAFVPNADANKMFKGLTFWMTGRTCVPDQELKRLIVERGGVYEQYGFTKVTHIIADNLAIGNQMWRELKKKTRRGHIITSQWVVDCVRDGRRIPETRYMPDCLKAGSTMLSFVGGNASAKAASASADAAGGMLTEAKEEQAEADGDRSTGAQPAPTAAAPLEAVPAVGLGSEMSATSEVQPPMQLAPPSADTTSLTGTREDPEEVPPTVRSASGSPSSKTEPQDQDQAVPEVAARSNVGGAMSSDAAPLWLLFSELFNDGIRDPARLQKETRKLTERGARRAAEAGYLVCSVALHVTLDPPEDWSCTAAVPSHPMSAGSSVEAPQGAEQDLAENARRLLQLVEALAETAARVLSLGACGAAANAASVRHMEVQLRLGTQVRIPAASTTTANAQAAQDHAEAAAEGKQHYPSGTEAEAVPPDAKRRRVQTLSFSQRGPRRRWRLLRRPPSRASESPQGISSVSDVAVGASAVEAIRLQSQVSASKAAKSSAEATDLARELINATSRIGAGWQTFSSMSTLVKRADQDAPQMAAAFWCLLEGQRYSAACFALKLIRRASEGSNAQKAIPFFNCLLREGLKALQMEGKSAPDIAPIAESC